MARNDMRLPDYQDPKGGNVTGSMTLPGQKRPVDSMKRIQGGAGGGNKNIGDASGQANIVDTVTQQSDGYRAPNKQPTLGNAVDAITSTVKDVGSPIIDSAGSTASRVGDVIGGTYAAHKERVAKEGVFPVIGKGIGDVASGVGSAIGGVASAAVSPINATSRHLFGPNAPTISQGGPEPTITSTTPGLDKYNTSQFKVSSAQPSIDRLNQGIHDIQTPSANSPAQLPATTEPTKLGTQQQPYKSFQGVAGTSDTRLQPDGTRNALTIGNVDSAGNPMGPGSGSVSFADNRTLSPERQSALGKILDKNADPAFQQRMRDQVAIVDARREQERVGDLRRSGQSDLDTFNKTLSAVGPDRRADILKDKMSNEANNATAMAGVGQKQSNDAATQSREATKSDREENRLNFDINKQGVSDKESASKNYYTALTAMADKGLDTPAQRFTLAKQHFGKDTMAHLPDVLGDNFKEYQALGDKQARQEYLIKLGIPL